MKKIHRKMILRNLEIYALNFKQMKKYTFKLLADDGQHIVSTVATDMETAKFLILEAEGCPERAIELIKEETI